MQNITFEVAVNNLALFQSNFMASPAFRPAHRHQILVQEKFASAATAYNDAIARSCNDLIVFAHQDIYLPQTWIGQLEHALSQLEARDPHWGVLGCYGTTRDGHGWGHVYSSGVGVIGG